MAMPAEIAFGDRFFLHLVSLPTGKFLEVARSAFEAARFGMVVVAEMDRVGSRGSEGDVSAADGKHRGNRSEQK